MRIILITQKKSEVLNKLLQSKEIIGIIEPREDNNLTSIIEKAIFKNVKSVAKKYKVPYLLMKDKKQDILGWIKEKNPDLIVVYSMPFLLKEEIFSFPKFGTINLHTALLPKYRGAVPIFWTYYFFDRDAGVTVHYIDKGEDTGDIILQKNVKVDLGERYYELRAKFENVGALALLESIEKIESNKVQRIKQPVESPTPRAKRVKKEDYLSLIDWNWDLERLWHFFRGTENYLKYLLIKNKFLFRIYRVEVGKMENTKHDFIVGTFHRDSDGKFIACKNGKIYYRLKLWNPNKR
ncbi:MAG: methionyl-tRNA formyltransferase [Candidatus Methanofastidiosum methylothiophilum]|uniref:Methionyl-tRNA formyltransferase n=1 Tax=Candidatus Methanofastidiosum methylothiophilum TaxID=1705564 RepID=A0A150II85_9EURY|nr:MAG: methionyl-tRNA formyltransferase [Candidatus Methanofastidiosum methylthiophilus]